MIRQWSSSITSTVSPAGRKRPRAAVAAHPSINHANRRPSERSSIRRGFAAIAFRCHVLALPCGGSVVMLVRVVKWVKGDYRPFLSLSAAWTSQSQRRDTPVRPPESNSRHEDSARQPPQRESQFPHNRGEVRYADPSTCMVCADCWSGRSVWQFALALLNPVPCFSP
jgi:hypothetical protein